MYMIVAPGKQFSQRGFIWVVKPKDFFHQFKSKCDTIIIIVPHLVWA